MSHTVTVPVLKPLTHQGRSYVRGEKVTTSSLDAAALARRGFVSLTKGVTVEPVEPEKPKRPARAGRGRYRRKDIVAEGDP